MRVWWLCVTQVMESPRHRVTMTGHADEARMDDDRETETRGRETLSENVRYCACAVWFVKVPRCQRAALRMISSSARAQNCLCEYIMYDVNFEIKTYLLIFSVYYCSSLKLISIGKLDIKYIYYEFFVFFRNLLYNEI